jgi:hypothetical protein
VPFYLNNFMNYKTLITLTIAPILAIAAPSKQKPTKPEREVVADQIKNEKSSKVKPERSDKPNRPALPEEIKTQIAELKEKQKEMHLARKEFGESLKEVSKEERAELIAQFKQDNKEQHLAIKQQAKEIKKQIRETVETGDTRTSDI